MERARELFHQYKVPTADGGVVPLSVYASVCLQSLDEDECIRMLYAWADRHTSSSDGDEDSDTEVAEPAVEEKKRWARRFSK